METTTESTEKKTLDDIPSKLPHKLYLINLKHREYGKAEPKEEKLDPNEANIISSEIFGTNKHAPVLDLDVKHAYVPSTTPGHGHLYIDAALSWKKYKKLLKTLAECGIIEQGYANASISKGFSGLRLPWIKKTKDEEKVIDGLDSVEQFETNDTVLVFNTSYNPITVASQSLKAKLPPKYVEAEDAVF